MRPGSLWYYYCMSLVTEQEQEVLDHILAAYRGILDLGSRL